VQLQDDLPKRRLDIKKSFTEEITVKPDAPAACPARAGAATDRIMGST